MTRLLRLALTAFRNYETFVWEPQASPVVITGENGSGKTNLLEALSLLVPGRGLRGARSIDLARRAVFGDDLPTDGSAPTAGGGWGVVGRFQDDRGIFEIATGLREGQTGARDLLLDGRSARNRAVIGDCLSAVWLTPQMDRLFGESAGGRRRFLDRLVAAIAPHHARELAACERATAQRNRLLAMGGGDVAWFAGIEDAMARHGVAVVAARRTLAAGLNRLPVGGADQGGVFPSATVQLLCPIADRLDNEPALAVEEWLRRCLRDNRERDRLRGQAHTGAHRSDFCLFDTETGRSASEASTGQQKALLIGIILAHTRVSARAGGVEPMLLLDEPLVHLDARRRDALLETVLEFRAPVLMTGTDTDPFERLRSRAQFLHLGVDTP